MENQQLTRLLKSNGLTRADLERKRVEEIRRDIEQCMCKQTNALDQIRCYFGDE
jgi:hypothetical protein